MMKNIFTQMLKLLNFINFEIEKLFVRFKSVPFMAFSGELEKKAEKQCKRNVFSFQKKNEFEHSHT